MLLFLSLLMIILSLILIIHNWNINRNAIFLSLFFILISIYAITHYFTINGNSVFWLAVFYNNFTALMLLSGPFLYFYVRGILKDRQGLSWKDSIHFFPAIIHLIGILPYIFSPFSYKESIAKQIIENVDVVKHLKMSVFFPVEFNFGLRIGLLTVYFIACLVHLYQFSHDNNKQKNIPERQLLISYRWIKFLLTLVFLLIANFLFITINFIRFGANHVAMHLSTSFMLAGISFTFLAIGMLFFPEILYGLPKRNAKEEVSTILLKNETHKINENKTEKVELSNEEDPFNELAEQIKIYLEKEKPFLDPNFSISQIALDLKTQQNHVSYCINSIFKTKFTKLKTELRVEHAKTLLNNSQYSNLTIEGIALMSGFGTRSNFYNAFKNETGLTPSDYLRNSTENI